MVDILALVCPLCRLTLSSSGGGLTCEACGRHYPVVAGIPDLRLSSDRYLDLEADRRKAHDLAELDDLSFPALVAEYWRRTPEVPPRLAAKYAATTGAGAARADAHLDRLGGCGPGDRVLDVGCGTGGLVEAALRRGATVVGVDIALRWLVIARRRLRDAGLDATLVAADGAVLPFRHGSFDITTCIDSLEHTADQRALVQSCLLSLRPGGKISVVCSNRFSVAPEPTVGLWGVGWLPRRLMPGYVRARRGTRYQFVRPVSARQMRSFAGLRQDVKVVPAPLPPAPADATATRGLLYAAHGWALARPMAHGPLVAFGPFLELKGTISGAGTSA